MFTRVLGCAVRVWSLSAEHFHQRYLRSRCDFRQPQNTPWPCKSRLFLPSSSEAVDSQSNLPDKKNTSAAKLELIPSYLSPSPKNIKNIKMGAGVPENQQPLSFQSNSCPFMSRDTLKQLWNKMSQVKCYLHKASCTWKPGVYSTSRLTATPLFGLKTGSVPLPLSPGLKPRDLTQHTAARVLHSTPAASSYAI